MRNVVTKFIKDESGATAIEYGLIASLIAVAIIVGAKLLGENLNDLFDRVAKCVAGGECKPTKGTTTPTTP